MAYTFGIDKTVEDDSENYSNNNTIQKKDWDMFLSQQFSLRKSSTNDKNKLIEEIPSNCPLIKPEVSRFSSCSFELRVGRYNQIKSVLSANFATCNHKDLANHLLQEKSAFLEYKVFSSSKSKVAYNASIVKLVGEVKKLTKDGKLHDCFKTKMETNNELIESATDIYQQPACYNSKRICHASDNIGFRSALEISKMTPSFSNDLANKKNSDEDKDSKSLPSFQSASALLKKNYDAVKKSEKVKDTWINVKPTSTETSLTKLSADNVPLKEGFTKRTIQQVDKSKKLQIDDIIVISDEDGEKLDEKPKKSSIEKINHKISPVKDLKQSVSTKVEQISVNFKAGCHGYTSQFKTEKVESCTGSSKSDINNNVEDTNKCKYKFKKKRAFIPISTEKETNEVKLIEDIPMKKLKPHQPPPISNSTLKNRKPSDLNPQKFKNNAKVIVSCLTPMYTKKQFVSKEVFKEFSKNLNILLIDSIASNDKQIKHITKQIFSTYLKETKNKQIENVEAHKLQHILQTII